MTMTDWQVTATTLYCDAVDADVTVMVDGDGSVRCAGLLKFLEKRTPEVLKQLKKRSRKVGRPLACEGDACQRTIAYRDRIFAEEKVG
jgi:hypothetical protein